MASKYMEYVHQLMGVIMKAEFRDIEGYPGYKVSRCGKVAGRVGSHLGWRKA